MTYPEVFDLQNLVSYVGANSIYGTDKIDVLDNENNSYRIKYSTIIEALKNQTRYLKVKYKYKRYYLEI